MCKTEHSYIFCAVKLHSDVKHFQNIDKTLQITHKESVLHFLNLLRHNYRYYIIISYFTLHLYYNINMKMLIISNETYFYFHLHFDVIC